MKISSAVAAQTALLAILTQSASAFAPTTFVPHAPARHLSSLRSYSSSSTSTSTSKTTTRLHQSTNYEDIGDQCLLTPEGYGFSSTAERIVQQAKRGENGGYVTVKSDARVIDVMAGITNGQEDVALVYDNAELLGIFTEFDYISVSLSFVFLMSCLCLFVNKVHSVDCAKHTSNCTYHCLVLYILQSNLI